MIFFKKIFSLFLFGILVQPVISSISYSTSTDLPHTKSSGIDSSGEEAPKLNYVVNPIKVEWKKLLPVTGVVMVEKPDSEKSKWKLALGRTYSRLNGEGLQATLKLNGLEKLWKYLEKYDKGQKPEKGWQILYMVNESGRVEGVGFVPGPFELNKPQEIPYIATRDNKFALLCIEKVINNPISKVQFLEVKGVSEEDLKELRYIVSHRYPRFLCMNDVGTCPGGHAGLSRFAFGSKLDPKSGRPVFSKEHDFFGLTLVPKDTTSFSLIPISGSTNYFTATKVKDVVKENMREIGINIAE